MEACNRPTVDMVWVSGVVPAQLYCSKSGWLTSVTPAGQIVLVLSTGTGTVTPYIYMEDINSVVRCDVIVTLIGVGYWYVWQLDANPQLIIPAVSSVINPTNTPLNIALKCSNISGLHPISFCF